MCEMFRVENLTYAYAVAEGQISLALNGVSLSIKKGEFVAILGHNGSGKSTLARNLNALLTPSSGRVLVFGNDTREDPIAARKNAGMVFQNPDNQLVATIVEEEVAFGPENLGIPREEIVLRVAQALKTVGMEPYAKRAPHMLSGGQKQRIAIAGVLAMQPKAIIFDEATAMLDPVGRREVLEMMHRLNRESGVTIVMITHYLEEACNADRVLVLKDGLLASEGTPREVFAQEEIVEAAGLRLPFAPQMGAELSRSGADLSSLPLTIEELVEEVCRLMR